MTDATPSAGRSASASTRVELPGPRVLTSLAHAVTNLALSVYVIGTGRWTFWM